MVKIIIFAINLMLISKIAVSQPLCPVIPMPEQAQKQASEFKLSPYTSILLSDEKLQQLKTALATGYQTVLCPRLPLYFDFVQDSTHTQGRKWNKLYNSLQNVYDFSAKALPGITKENSKQILGIQANLWTETIPNEQQLDYMLFPRIAALAESAWVADANKNFNEFMLKQKLIFHYTNSQVYFITIRFK